MQFNGVLLLSSILNYGVRDCRASTTIYITYLPSYAATAAYHGKIAAPADMGAFLHEVRDWAPGPTGGAGQGPQHLRPSWTRSPGR